MDDLIYCYGCQRWHQAKAFDAPTDAARKCRAYIEHGRLAQLSAETDAQWRRSPERVREMVEHFFATGTRPGRGMVAM